MGRVVRLELSFLAGVAFSAIKRLGRGGGGAYITVKCIFFSCTYSVTFFKAVKFVEEVYPKRVKWKR